VTRSPSDTLSLTLPSRSKSRARWKRPRKPTLWEAWFLAWTVFSIFWAVGDLLAAHLTSGVYFMGCAGFWWRGYQRVRRGHVFGLDLFALGWVTGLGILLLVLGVPG
jgi:hypothetical protein